MREAAAATAVGQVSCSRLIIGRRRERERERESLRLLPLLHSGGLVGSLDHSLLPRPRYSAASVDGSPPLFALSRGRGWSGPKRAPWPSQDGGQQELSLLLPLRGCEAGPRAPRLEGAKKKLTRPRAEASLTSSAARRGFQQRGCCCLSSSSSFLSQDELAEDGVEADRQARVL